MCIYIYLNTFQNTRPQPFLITEAEIIVFMKFLELNYSQKSMFVDG